MTPRRLEAGSSARARCGLRRLLAARAVGSDVVAQEPPRSLEAAGARAGAAARRCRRSRSARSSNGLPVWLVEAHEVPLVQVNLVVHGRQRRRSRRASSASASLTAAMLDEGAGARSALEIADAVEFLGASLTTTSSFDASAVRLNVPVRAAGGRRCR